MNYFLWYSSKSKGPLEVLAIDNFQDNYIGIKGFFIKGGIFLPRVVKIIVRLCDSFIYNEMAKRAQCKYGTQASDKVNGVSM